MQRRGVLLAALSLCALCSAGPLGPLPNETISEIGLETGGCTVGDTVHQIGDSFPGVDPCERCRCSASGAVQCARQECEPRPGCKALHRPDHCCPTYQCECEQEGRVYGNGEKLVDPLDPCRVCYCQGGEVVCRRIACFVRDDCRPRLVPGRCCPEYDNCPLRGVTATPGANSSSISTIEDFTTSPSLLSSTEKVRQEITIKEITPVSEIPIHTEVKIKEILPSPSVEAVDYSSSKAPLIVREATSEISVSSEHDAQTETTTHGSVLSSSTFASTESPLDNVKIPSEPKQTDSSPSKISFSTQDAINSDIYAAISPQATTATTIVPPSTEVTATITTKASIMEEEDTSLFEHNPAFPQLPDDLSVLGNHEDELLPESSIHGETPGHSVDVLTTTPTETPVLTSSTTMVPKTEKSKVEKITETTPSTQNPTTFKFEVSSTAKSRTTKDSPMLNMRAAIPTKLLNMPASVPDEITGELDEEEESVSETDQDIITSLASSTVSTLKEEKILQQSTKAPVEKRSTTESSTILFETTTQNIESQSSSTETLKEQTTNSIPKSNMATEFTSQTELSSLPVETSDQNPPATNEKVEEIKVETTSSEPVTASTSVKIIQTEIEPITISRAPSTLQQTFDYVETTEFMLSPYDSSESTTDSVEVIKISNEQSKSAPIIDPTSSKKNNVLNDLIKLVDDVASISNNTSDTEATRAAASATTISDSEELIPLHGSYKSKNKNWNVNTITEVPTKIKTQTPVNKQKMVEIDYDEGSITDSPVLNDKTEPTTRRPIIDNVSEDNNMAPNKTSKKEVEIITQSYVPTFNKRPTKVVMKKNSERVVTEEVATKILQTSAEVATEDSITDSKEEGTTNSPVQEVTETRKPDYIAEITESTTISSSSPQ